MTLFKQLFIGVSLGFLFLLAGIEWIYVNNAKAYLQDQLTSHSQDAATSLSIALSSSMADGDVVRAETIVSAIFDRGYYQFIRIITAPGDTVIYKSLPVTPLNIPTWFTTQVKLEAPVAESMISKGWRQLGRVVVSSHPQFAYEQLWHTTIGVSFWLLGVYVASLVLIYIFLKNILKPLAEIEQVAHAISARNFKVVKATPKTRELLAVVNAINTLSSKVRSAIEIGVSTASYLRMEANTDELTKLENRRSFEQQLQAILDKPADFSSGTLFIIHIANFNEFNSIKGYRRGDELLKLTSSVLASTWAERNFIRSRINGATFAIVAFNFSHDTAASFGHEICGRLSEAIESRQFEFPVSFGCGGTYFKNEKVTLGGLMAEADMAMLQSISKGDSKLILLDYPMEEKNEGKGSLFWKQFIVNALNENRLALLAQPVIAFADSAQIQHEVMGRLIDVDGALIPASQFMPMAIRHGLNSAVDMKLMEKIFRVMSEHNEQFNQVAINLSIRSIHDPELISWLTLFLSSHPEVANKTVFEFSELGIVQDLVSIGKFVANIRRLGANFAVDNFGLHRSAFEYLQTLRPAYIKLSPIFIVDLLQNRANQFFISSVVKITKPLEINVFAHSIENEGVLEALKKLGIDGYQGFATGAPTRID